MALSNKWGHVLLNTSNKSEAAVGYGTLYGDMAGSLSVIGDLLKTEVYALANYLNKERVRVPINTIQKPPSAELRPDQKDSDSLPDYEVLDRILTLFIEENQSIASIKKQVGDEAVVDKILRMLERAEFKRFQSPPILRVSKKAFGPGRLMPLVGKWLG
jgi:NAD+ synthase (glutamine-hydrolysing)